MKVKPVPGYLTKRIVVSASKKAISKASKETVRVMGHNVIAKDGWIVKKYADGSFEKLQKIEGSHNGARHKPLKLD
jgi:hypothetical protein